MLSIIWWASCWRSALHLKNAEKLFFSKHNFAACCEVQKCFEVSFMSELDALYSQSHLPFSGRKLLNGSFVQMCENPNSHEWTTRFGLWENAVVGGCVTHFRFRGNCWNQKCWSLKKVVEAEIKRLICFCALLSEHVIEAEAWNFCGGCQVDCKAKKNCFNGFLIASIFLKKWCEIDEKVAFLWFFASFSNTSKLCIKFDEIFTIFLGANWAWEIG